jgi:penicillin V acylase-like amidase (Ntn superfamily)
MRSISATFVTSVLLVILTPSPSAPSSSFCLDADGAFIVGSNFDNCEYSDGLVIVNKRGVQKRGYSPGTDGEYATWTSRYGSVSFSLAGREMVRYGMNEAGLVVTTAELPQSRCPDADKRPPLEGDFWAQYLLDNFKSVQEAVASDSTVRIVTEGNHYLVCDREGNAAVIECLDGKLLSYSGDSAPVKIISNAPYADCLDHWKRGIIPESDPDASFERFLGAAEWLHDYEPRLKPAVDYAFEILDYTSQGQCTQWKIVFDTQSLQVHFRTKRARNIREIDLRDLNFQCSAPMMMLDVNDKLSGDVSRNFTDYSHETDLSYMQRALAAFGAKKTPEQMVELLDFFEGFKCAEAGQ